MGNNSEPRGQSNTNNTQYYKGIENDLDEFVEAYYQLKRSDYAYMAISKELDKMREYDFDDEEYVPELEIMESIMNDYVTQTLGYKEYYKAQVDVMDIVKKISEKSGDDSLLEEGTTSMYYPNMNTLVERYGLDIKYPEGDLYSQVRQKLQARFR